MKKRVSFSTQQLVVDEDGTMVVEEMPADCTTTYHVTSKEDEVITDHRYPPFYPLPTN
jgi:hypothetical protein